MKPLSCIIPLACALLLGNAIVTKGQDTSIKSKPGVQELIAQFATHGRATNRPPEILEPEKWMKVKLAELEGSVDGRHDKLVQELLIYNTRTTNMEQAMVVYFLMERVNVSKEDIVSALLPCLEVKDQALRTKAAEWLARADSGVTNGPPDFRKYEKILEEQESTPPYGLLRYMFSTFPEAAIVSAARVFGDGRELGELSSALGELSPKLTPKAKESLKALANRPEWWAQLYVATKMEDPALKDLEILKRLEKAQHPLVREKLMEMQNKQGASKPVVKPSSAIASNAIVQAEINRIVSLCRDPSTSEADGQKAVEGFLKFQGLNEKELLLQALLAYRGASDFQEGPQVEALKRTLIFRLADRIPENERIEFLVHYLEACSDSRLRENIVIPLNAILFKDGRHPPAYDKLEPLLASMKDSPPTNLIDHVMFRNNPHAALNTLARVYVDEPEKRNALQVTAASIGKASQAIREHAEGSQKLRSGAITELMHILNREEWWARMYVVVLLEKERSLRTPELISKLKEDPAPLIREKVSTFK